MSIGENLGSFIAGFINSLKQESLEWKKNNQMEIDRLKNESKLSDLELDHKIEKMKIIYSHELEKVELAENNKVKRFKDFLGTLDELRDQMVEKYKEMPKATALIIHHHATELLTDAWHSEEIKERITHHQDFLDLMLYITEDLSNPKNKLPEKTIEKISSTYESVSAN